MRKFPRTALAILAVAVAASAAVAATSASIKKARRPPTSACSCPDSKSSVRWETQDRPRLAAAFKCARRQLQHRQRRGQCLDAAQPGPAVPDERRQGDPARQPRLRLRRGDREAREVQGRAVDRLRPPDAEGRRRRTTSRSTTSTVGQLQGQGLINCLNASGVIKQASPVIAELNGAPTDNNAKLFAQGYNGVLEPVYKNGHAQEGPEPVGAAVGQPEGADDLPGHADPDEQQDPGACSRPMTASATRRSRR